MDLNTPGSRMFSRFVLLVFSLALLPWPTQGQWTWGSWGGMTLLCDPESSLVGSPRYDFTADSVPALPRRTLPQPLLDGVSSLERSLAAERADLRWALRECGAEEAMIAPLLERHAVERNMIMVHDKFGWPDPPQPLQTRGCATVPEAWPRAVEGLPEEFTDYVNGYVWWQAGHAEPARAYWTQLLSRPSEQRFYKSVWAAYMLGRSWEADDPGEAVAWYRRARDLVREGFSDRLNLYEASLGREGRIHVRQRHYGAALEVQVQHLAEGESFALKSILFTCREACSDRPGMHTKLARHPLARELITEHLMSQPWWRWPIDVDPPWMEATLGVLERVSWLRAGLKRLHRQRIPVDMWIEAVEATGVTNADFAEKMCLLAFRGEEWEAAALWSERAGDRPVARWIRAKLEAKACRVETAFQLLNALRADLLLATGPESASWRSLLDKTYVPAWYRQRLPADEVIEAEWAALQVIRGHYEIGLESFLRTHFWRDAAYLAEQVLSLEELQACVARFDKLPVETWAVRESRYEPVTHSFEWLRYLLARRLMRADRLREALAFYPASLQDKARQYVELLERARDTTRTDVERATAYWEAALMARRGSDLLGKEETWIRITRGGFTPWRDDEEARVARHRDVAERIDRTAFAAAELGWEAAQLMPNNDPATAQVLCQAGTWVKYADPPYADRFYKALVLRCRQTELGDWADKKRWFPKMDLDGKLLVQREPAR